ncbi:hypothetical protein BDR26DRAFT_849411 [Obelidium mucronatum]|nr:hypothetical protein BDR26DRAFT_849411 [Obelidium mucronatum]
MAPTRARPSFSFATPRAASGSISALKSSTALTANFGSSFAMGDSGGVVNTHVQEYALPSNLHLDYKPTLAGSSVLAPDFRNGLTGRKVNNDTQLQTSAPSGTSPQNRMLPRPSTMAMRTSTILERHETSTLDLSAPHTHHRQTSITLSTMDLTPGNGNGARSSDVASFAFRTNRRGITTHRKRSSSMLGDSLDSHNDSFNNYGKQNSTFGLGSIAGFAPQESAAVKWTRELPTNTKHGDRVADVPEMDSNTSNLATSPTAAATGGGKQYFLLEAQHKHFDSQRSKPSFIPRPASRIEQYIERVEIVPLSLVPPAEKGTVFAIKESIEAVCVIDPFNVPYPSTQDPTSSSTTASNKLTPESKAPKLARPHTVPPGKSKPIDMTRFSKSAKPARVGGGHGSKLKAKKLEEILIDTKTGKKQGFGTAVEKRKTISDPMEALLSTHTNTSNNNKPPQKPSTAPSRIRTTETTTNGPCLPHLESRPITTYLKNRLRDPHAFNPTNIPTTTPNGTRQFQADSTISPYSQPLPITRYIPNSQKQPSKHAAKLRGLRAQHEFQIQEAYLGDTAIAPKWFMKHAQMVVEQKVQQGLMFGGCVQGLVPSFNTRKPSHVVFSTLGEGSLAGNQDQEHGETRKMLDDLLKRHRIKRMVDETLVDASSQENRLEDFIYSKNKPPSKKEEDKPIQFRARKSRYLEQLFVEAFSM